MRGFIIIALILKFLMSIFLGNKVPQKIKILTDENRLCEVSKCISIDSNLHVHLFLQRITDSLGNHV